VLVVGVAGNKTLERVHIIQSHYRHTHTQTPQLTQQFFNGKNNNKTTVLYFTKVTNE